MAVELNINKEAIRQILHEDSQKRKMYAKFTPHRLTDEQKQRRLTSSQHFTSRLVKTIQIFLKTL
jgi:hypothetical protein